MAAAISRHAGIRGMPKERAIEKLGFVQPENWRKETKIQGLIAV